ncbi:MAG: ATP-binding cassette domain-containing protein [bacterium]|nr:ATP-binding cassette domain-containing protein [bacterium]
MKTVSVQNVSKQYRVYFEKPALVRNIMPFLISQGRPQEFWAMREVEFELEEGECIGVIGPNGSGKSTLLSVLAGVTAPTMGSVRVNGRISSLLSLGAGFQFDLTGQENIYLNGSILGLPKAHIDRIYGEIVEYAGLGKFINAKIATYSSGMNMRLGFAIAITVPFDVLLIDEILAVGDMEFQTKCYNTMKTFYEDEKKTIVFVSHALERIEALCSRVLWFEHGRIEEFDTTDVVLSKYRERYKEKFQHMPLKTGAAGRRLETEKVGLARIEVDADRVVRRVPAGLFGSNLDWLNEGFYFWDRKNRRVLPDVLRHLLPYSIRSLRYPGSVQTDFFHWHEAVGDARRPQRCGYPGNPDAYPYFGPDEFLSMCAAAGAEPFISLNVGTGTAEEAEAWVRHYAERGLRGLQWELGHELYYDDFHPLGVEFPFSPEQYAEKAATFIERVRAADPEARVGAIGCCDSGVFTRYRRPDWNAVVLGALGDRIDFLAVHNSAAPVLNVTPDDRTPDWDETYAALMAAPIYVANNMEIVKSHLAAHCPERVRIAASQYGVLFDFVPGFLHRTRQVKGRRDTDENWRQNKTLGAALYEAMLLNLFIREPRVTHAHRYSIMHTLYSSLWETGGQEPLLHPQAYVQRLYCMLAGKCLVETAVRADTFSTSPVGVIPAMEGVPYLDVIAARNEEGTKLSVFVVNRHLFQEIGAEVLLKNYAPVQVVSKVLTGPFFDASNQPHDPWNVRCIESTRTVAESTDTGTGCLRVLFPKHSLTVLSFSPDEWL